MAKKTKEFKSTGKEKPFNKQILINKIVGIISNNPQKTYNYKQISTILEIKDNGIRILISKLLEELKKNNTLEEIERGKFKLKSKIGYVIGTVRMTTFGYAFISSDTMDEEIFISQKNLNKALDGDQVKVFLYAKVKKGNIEGQVIEIIKRTKTSFVGTLDIGQYFAFLVPDNKKMPYDIFIPLTKLNGALNGQKAVASITEWPEKAKNPVGEIIDVLGTPGENDTEIHAILAEFGLPYKFQEEINAEAEKISDIITTEEIKKRRDFRSILTFTIDPYDAKDFDDALSILKLENGNWEIGVHIADVSHFVKPGTLLDQEAYNRATSIYLVDRVIPMLPEKLSNMVCSLRPNEEKLCFSAVFELDNNAEIHNQWFGKTIIKSDKRFTYEEAQKVIETEEGELVNEILIMNNLAKKLRKKRYAQGSIDFERMEVKFNIDSKGKPLGIMIKENKESNKLVEEFMLLANRKVAELFAPDKKEKKDKKVFVYRIHDYPNRDKLGIINNFIKKFGYHLNLKNDDTLNSSLNKSLEDVKGKTEQNLIETLFLRAMAKAKYTTENIGHYGLAFKHYTHFTSPIRRYPDVMVHRLLEDYLNYKYTYSPTQLEKDCEHSSNMEKLAVDAERASIKYKQVEYMSDKIGIEFDGIISGVSQVGVFVEMIENKCEGLVPISEIADDFYEYDEDHFCLKGRRFGKKYQLGDKVRVKVYRINIQKKHLDLKLVEKGKNKV